MAARKPIDNDEGWETFTAIFAGIRLGTDSKQGVLFYDGEQKLFFTNPKTTKNARTNVIGGIYELSRNGDNYRVLNIFKGMSSDRRIPEWRAEKETIEIEARTKKLITEGKTLEREAIAELLKPLRQLYARTDRTGRLALEVLVLAALRRPSWRE